MRFRLIILILGLAILGLNLYGLVKNLEPNIKELNQKYGLRFSYQEKNSYEETLKIIGEDISSRSILEQVKYFSNTVKNRMTHPNWDSTPANEFNLSVPVWENYILYSLRYIYKDPQIIKYHFSGYKKSLERGIGICGDSAVILSSILRIKGIAHKMIAYDGHVIINFRDENNNEFSVDPDFNVIFPAYIAKDNSVNSVNSVVRKAYLQSGYSMKDVDYLSEIYSGSYNIFNNHIHFMTKRYYFEKFSYIIKWLLPLLFIFQFFFVSLKEKNRRAKTS